MTSPSANRGTLDCAVPVQRSAAGAIAPGYPSDPADAVGRYVRRLDEDTPAHRIPWAQIVMTVPSPSGPCWLVCFIDGDVDVWRPEDGTVRYEFQVSPGGQP